MYLNNKIRYVNWSVRAFLSKMWVYYYFDLYLRKKKKKEKERKKAEMSIIMNNVATISNTNGSFRAAFDLLWSWWITRIWLCSSKKFERYKLLLTVLKTKLRFFDIIYYSRYNIFHFLFSLFFFSEWIIGTPVCIKF